MVAGYRPSSSRKWLEHFLNQRGWPTIWKDIPLTWRRYSMHLSILSGPRGSQTSYQSYWIICPPWVDQEGCRFRESSTVFWLWFYLGPGNQCRVARLHISSIPTWLESRKVMSWDGCSPCGTVLGSAAWSPHSLAESGGRLSHWRVVHWCHIDGVLDLTVQRYPGRWA
jgi:hypothetical protein